MYFNKMLFLVTGTFPNDVNEIISKVMVSKYCENEEECNIIKKISYNALWDTGANYSLISKKVINDLGLRASGIGEIKNYYRKKKTKII